MATSAPPLESLGSRPPKVTVIVPTYKTAPFIAETLDSVFGQTFDDFEVIVINDGSPDTDELEIVIQPYVDRIRYVKQRNRGLPGARNVGVRLARGELLAFVDSDDVWMPEYLSCQVEFLNSHPNVYASIADALLFGSCPETTWRMLKKGTSPILGFEQVLKRVGGQLPSAMVARRWRVLQVGMFDEAMRIGEDIEFFVRLCCPDGKIGYLGQVLVKYRQRPGSITDDPRHRKWNRAESRALRRLAKKLNLTPAHSRLLTNEISECIAGLALSDAYRHIYNGDFSRASRCIRIANTHYRKSRLALFVVCLNLFPRLAVLLLYWHSKFFNKRVHEQIPLAPLQN